MQRRFIGGLKENLKALKQEFTGGDIYNGEVRFPKYYGHEVEFVIKSSIYTKEFSMKSDVHKKEFGIETKIYGISKENIIPEVKSFTFGMDTNVRNYNFEKPVIETQNKNLEKFITVTKAKQIELSRKSKIKNIEIDKFKIKTYEGTDKIRQIPVIIEGRRFVSNKELIDLAIRIKTENRSLDFTKYNFKAVFENLLVDLIDDYQYVDDSVELKIYYKKYSRKESSRKQLVILTEKNSLNTEKIFI